MTAIILPLLPNRTVDLWGGTQSMGDLVLHGADRGHFVPRLCRNPHSGPDTRLACQRSRRRRCFVHGGNNCACPNRKGRRQPVAAGWRGGVGGGGLDPACFLVVLLVEPSPISAIAPAALVAALCFASCGMLLLMNSDERAASGTPARNPFELGPLLLFALLFAIVSTANAALAGQ